ncbi:MAG TPA: MarR family winged helix-turn-helix transcriptional regulator [Streptosporangiaceae bacterium]|nr:MarR family winged helix-turn-helix transcriptional regulator [Streptosporangiaceae bacterium]
MTASGPGADSQGPHADAIEAMQAATRVLAGVALRSVDALAGAVTLAQYRMLAVLAGTGPARSARVAEALGLEPSTVTRLADRLVAAGHVARGADPGHRSVVTLALTASGRRIVRTADTARRDELSRIFNRMSPADREHLAGALRGLVAAAGEGYGMVPGNPVPR